MYVSHYSLINVEKFTVVMEMAEILVRIIDVTKDSFTLQDVGIDELQIRDRTESNLVEIVRLSS
jgi:hypothetical protein